MKGFRTRCGTHHASLWPVIVGCCLDMLMCGQLSQRNLLMMSSGAGLGGAGRIRCRRVLARCIGIDVPCKHNGLLVHSAMSQGNCTGKTVLALHAAAVLSLFKSAAVHFQWADGHHDLSLLLAWCRPKRGNPGMTHAQIGIGMALLLQVRNGIESDLPLVRPLQYQGSCWVSMGRCLRRRRWSDKL